MSRDLETEIRQGLYGPGTVRLEYTCRAFQMLPPMHRPRILDIGCGKGGPTLELARLSHGEVIGMDPDHSALNRLSQRVEA